MSATPARAAAAALREATTKFEQARAEFDAALKKSAGDAGKVIAAGKKWDAAKAAYKAAIDQHGRAAGDAVSRAYREYLAGQTSSADAAMKAAERTLPATDAPAARTEGRGTKDEGRSQTTSTPTSTSTSTSTPARAAAPPATRPTYFSAATEARIARAPYTATVRFEEEGGKAENADIRVDLQLPPDVATEFEGALPGLAARSKSKEELLENIRQWAFSYTHAEGWHDSTLERMSLAFACKEKARNCTTNTALVYSLMLRARERLAGKRGANLDGVEFGFKQVFVAAFGTGHVCMTARVGGKDIDCDIAGLSTEDRSPQYGSDESAKMGLPEAIARILCNRAFIEVKRGGDPASSQIKAYYEVAAKLAPSHALVARDLLALADNLRRSEREKDAKKYAETAMWIIRKAQEDTNSTYYRMAAKDRENLIASANALAHNLQISSRIADKPTRVASL